MKIKTLLHLFFLLSVLISTSLISLIMFQKNDLDRMITKGNLANEIVKVISQREKIISNYINDHQPENIILWQLMYEITVKLLQSDAFDTQEEQEILASMREDNVAKNKLLSELIVFEQSNTAQIKGNASSQIVLNKFKLPLTRLSESIMSDAYRLNEINQKNIKNTLELVYLIVMCSVLTLVVLCFLVLFILKRKIYTPLLMLNEGIKSIGMGDLDFKINAHRNDEMGQLIKSFNEMAHKLNDRTIEQEQIRNKLEKSNRANVYIARHDSLTNLPNAVLAKLFLNNAIENARNTNTIVAVIDLDLDNFKRINNTIGHLKANLLIKEVGKRLLKITRNNIDLVARFGANEFYIIVPLIKSRHEITAATKKIQKAITKPFSIDKKEFYLTASIGISLYPFDGTEVNTLVEQADFAMYQAKNIGRNNIQFALQELRDLEKKKGEMEAEMHHGIQNNQFILYYQPIVDTKTQAINGMEALIRWKNDKGEIINPEEFIPIAERSDLIVTMGEWVLETASKQFKEWQKYGLQSMDINISVHQLSDRLLDLTKKIMKQLELPPGGLIFEITETVLMQQTDVMLRFNKILTEMGVSISIDDFGTGYSSFTYLNKFKISNLKLDISFIKDVNKNKRKAAVCKAILQMARTLNIKTIAEGVETQEEFEFLKENGCDETQGFYFSKPLPPDEVEKLLQRNAQYSSVLEEFPRSVG
ncbi:inner membrane protein/sensory box protein LssE [Legionella moravica]|uniref:Inner membrane protein PLUS sensory box protein LssE n=2 Tax=Legionella moravica TaxID=39962 RepID=A0A378JW26_9GAMM|nr:inner membrane protein/sensory box protein LssE [Legionella moravica]STX62240.1 inner membrane protein PLUS sensory box protein LssE [Legionella moravica]